MIRVLVDENIPIPSEYSSPEVELISIAGREITSLDLQNIDALLVRSVTKVDADLLKGVSISFVGSATAGIDHLDTNYLQNAGIPYFYAAGSNARSVVDYVLCSLAALNVDPRTHSIGILGCGQVGSRVYERMRALDCECSCYDPFLSDSIQADLCDLDQVLSAEILCLHTPLTSSGPFPTKNMLRYEQLRKLPFGAVLINAGRGGVVNEADLKKILLERSDIRLVMDVWEDEPNIDKELLTLCQIGTPHIAGYAAIAKYRGSQMVFDALFSHFQIDRLEVTADMSNGYKLIEASEWDRALLEIYDPRADDALLRKAKNAEDFDLLRKDYPHRNEIAEFISANELFMALGCSRP